MNSLFWRLCERLYSTAEPPPRARTKPMQVLCVGLPRSGTESLQKALLRLGYDYTFHVRIITLFFSARWSMAKLPARRTTPTIQVEVVAK